MAKIVECTDGPWFTTIEFEAKHHQRRPSSGLRDGSRQPGTAPEESVPAGREPHPQSHLQSGFRLSRPERTALAEIGKRLGRKLLQQVASVANPDTILGWYRQLVAAKFDGSRQRRLPVSDQTVGNILRRHGIAPAPERKRTTTWSQFIRSHMAVLAGTDFFTVEVLTWRGLVAYYVLFFLHLETRRVTIAGITDQPEESWMQQMARNATLEGEGWSSLGKIGYLLHDRDTKYCASFRETLAAGGVKCLRLPARSPNLNSYTERWVRTVKEECLSKLILFGEGSLRRALREFEGHFHGERNHQGKGNVLLFPCGEVPTTKRGPSIRCHQRLAGLLEYYHRKAA